MATAESTSESIEHPSKKQKREKSLSRRQYAQAVKSVPKHKFEPREKKEGEVEEERRPKRKCAMVIGYCGTGYHGLQFNVGNKTIEGDLFEALVKAGAISKLNADDPKKISLQRAARTDRGVHAAFNVISGKFIMEDNNIVELINNQLPEPIRVWDVIRTTNNFSSYISCDSRIYEYFIPTFCFLTKRDLKTGGESVKPTEEISLDMEQDKVFWERLQIGELGEHGELPDNAMHRLSRTYRVTPTKLARIRRAFSFYNGTQNFHNYTIGVGPTLPSAKRFIKSIEVSDPKIISETEWVGIKLHGNSFMLHQIRKQISHCVLILRNGLNPDVHLPYSFTHNKVHIPKAPALGLVLERPIFSAYNKRALEENRNVIECDEARQDATSFKEKWIYAKIWEEEEKGLVFGNWTNFLDVNEYHTGIGFRLAALLQTDAEQSEDEQEVGNTSS